MTLPQLTISNESDAVVDVPALAGLVEHAFRELRLHAECELGITLVDEERMTTLHEDWMQEPGPTDVLSFPIDEVRAAAMGHAPVPGILGDIVLCPSFVRARAATAGRTLDEELQFLTVHGLLHLVGWDHATPEEYDAMFALQDEVLSSWRGATQ